MYNENGFFHPIWKAFETRCTGIFSCHMRSIRNTLQTDFYLIWILTGGKIWCVY
jgi:hypothetical protein